MSKHPDRVPPAPSERPTRWLSWLTLLAGAAMCAVAVSLS